MTLTPVMDEYKNQTANKNSSRYSSTDNFVLLHRPVTVTLIIWYVHWICKRRTSGKSAEVVLL
jgi:hypothetical protein